MSSLKMLSFVFISTFLCILYLQVSVEAQDSVCLATSCTRGGRLHDYCNEQCIAAEFLNGGTCSGLDPGNPLVTRCVCYSNGLPDRLYQRATCEKLCGPACEACGYKAESSVCAIVRLSIQCGCGN